MPGNPQESGLPDLRRLAAVVGIGLAVYWLLPQPESVSDEGWRLLGVFSTAIAGLILRPFPGGAVIFLVLVAAVWTGTMSLEQALSGFATPAVWLVVGALLIAHVLIETSLAKRVALLFVRFFGATSNGVAYALILSDLSLATMIPSNTSRAGGVIMPITRSLAELYGSKPGTTASLLGTFLMVAVYQGEAVASATFLTGQAGNFIAVEIAATLADYGTRERSRLGLDRLEAPSSRDSPHSTRQGVCQRRTPKNGGDGASRVDDRGDRQRRLRPLDHIQPARDPRSSGIGFGSVRAPDLRHPPVAGRDPSALGVGHHDLVRRGDHPGTGTQRCRRAKGID